MNISLRPFNRQGLAKQPGFVDTGILGIQRQRAGLQITGKRSVQTANDRETTDFACAEPGKTRGEPVNPCHPRCAGHTKGEILDETARMQLCQQCPLFRFKPRGKG